MSVLFDKVISILDSGPKTVSEIHSALQLRTEAETETETETETISNEDKWIIRTKLSRKLNTYSKQGYLVKEVIGFYKSGGKPIHTYSVKVNMNVNVKAGGEDDV